MADYEDRINRRGKSRVADADHAGWREADSNFGDSVDDRRESEASYRSVSGPLLRVENVGTGHSGPRAEASRSQARAEISPQIWTADDEGDFLDEEARITTSPMARKPSYGDLNESEETLAHPDRQLSLLCFQHIPCQSPYD